MKEVWPVMLTLYKDDGTLDEAANRRLVDWYIDNHVDGIFTVCLSSEMFALSQPERLQLARLTVEQANGRVPVVACGGFGNTLQERLEDIRAIAAQGVHAVILSISSLVAEDDSDEELEALIMALIDQSPGVLFGLYECPEPYKRLLSPGILQDLLLKTDRIGFLKDTCCDLNLLKEKAEATRHTPIKILNANITTLLDSAMCGCDGYCGVAANVFPGVLATMMQYVNTVPEKARLMQRVVNMLEFAVECHYPVGAKALLKSVGIASSDFSRTCTQGCSRDEFTRLLDCLKFIDLWTSHDYV